MIAIYPGSFDPVTCGHIDIAKRAARVADQLIVAVLDNPYKETLFSVSERVAFLQHTLMEEANIKIDAFSGLLADYATKKGAGLVIRGVRNGADLESEARYAHYNRLLSGGVETLLLTPDPTLSYMSSSIVREVAKHVYPNNLDDTVLGTMVPPIVQAALKARLCCET